MVSVRPILLWATLVLLVALAVKLVSGLDLYLLLTLSRFLFGFGEIPCFVAACLMVAAIITELIGEAPIKPPRGETG